MMRIAAILLAAGRGSRFGAGSKLLADLGGRPVVDWAAAAIEAAGIAPRAAVVRPGDEAVRAAVAAHGFETIENPRADEGMGTSIAAGAAWAQARGADGLLVCVGDAPFVRPLFLRVLAESFALLEETAPSAVVAARDGDRAGNPAVFGREIFPDLAALEGDQGARRVIQARGALAIACAPGELDDVDTPEALEAARRRIA